MKRVPYTVFERFLSSVDQKGVCTENSLTRMVFEWKDAEGKTCARRIYKSPAEPDAVLHCIYEISGEKERPTEDFTRIH